MDTTKLGELAAQFMEELTEEYGDNEEEEIDMVVMAVELKDSESTVIVTKSSDDRAWVEAAFFEAASESIHEQEVGEEAE